MEYEEHLLRLVAFHGAAHLVQQLHVVARRADIDQVVGVAGEFVDHGALRRLVGDEPGLETGLVEQRREPLAAVEFGMFVGRNGREDQRHALVRGVALREHVAENDQVIDLRKAGIRLAVVTVQLPVHRTRGFADDVDVYLAPRRLGRARRTVGEILRGLLEIVGLAEFRGAQVYVVEHVERKDLVPQHVPVFAHAVGRPQRQHAQRHEHRSARRSCAWCAISAVCARFRARRTTAAAGTSRRPGSRRGRCCSAARPPRPGWSSPGW